MGISVESSDIDSKKQNIPKIIAEPLSIEPKIISV
jgi:hypothetical protein